jgi:hypothetical protein
MALFSAGELSVMTKVHVCRIASLSMSAIALWGWTAEVVRWLFPDDFLATLVIVEIAVSIGALALWRKAPEESSPLFWLGIAAVSLLLLIFFVEISRGGGLQIASGKPSCPRYKPGITMVFDMSAFVMTLAAPACALYKALLQILIGQQGNASNA